MNHSYQSSTTSSSFTLTQLQSLLLHFLISLCCHLSEFSSVFSFIFSALFSFCFSCECLLLLFHLVTFLDILFDSILCVKGRWCMAKDISPYFAWFRPIGGDIKNPARRKVAPRRELPDAYLKFPLALKLSPKPQNEVGTTWDYMPFFHVFTMSNLSTLSILRFPLNSQVRDRIGH